MILDKAIKEAINQFGLEIIKEPRLINILSDYHAFEIKATRTILREIIKLEYTKELYNLDITQDASISLKAMNYVQELKSQGFQEGCCKYVFQCLLSALGKSNEVPQFIETEEAENIKPINKESFTVNGVNFTVCMVEGGSFSIGATPEQGIYASFDEKPSIDVSLDDFFIAETPVTQELWDALMNENPSHFHGSDLPVERVTWDECIMFIDKLNAVTGRKFRLPTEAEWEYAARGGIKSLKTKYSGADDDHIGDCVWYKENTIGIQPVKTKSPNELGIYDMSGNVSEWCSDWYFNSYSMGGSLHNPTGPTIGESTVIRGGSWNDKAINCRVSKRAYMNPAYRSKQIGFRVALSNQ